MSVKKAAIDSRAVEPVSRKGISSSIAVHTLLSTSRSAIVTTKTELVPPMPKSIPWRARPTPGDG